MEILTVFEVIFKLFSKPCFFHLCRKEGIEVRIVKRGEYDEDTVRWADAIISAGGKAQDLLFMFDHFNCTPVDT